MELIDDTGRIIDPFRNFIHVSRYARWLDSENRRETWVETVDRYINFMVDHLKTNVGYTPQVADVNMVREYILDHKALPSMRALMTAGPALERNNVAGYNCSYIVIDDPVAFDETLYILMNGTGVGFSAEARYVSKLPIVPISMYYDYNVIKVEDSKEGWAYALRNLIFSLYRGFIPQWDVSMVRPAGSRLMTFGGRSSGPAPLVDLFEFVVSVFRQAAGRQLLPTEVHSIICKIASVVVVGGVRRSALISLGDLNDSSMRDLKSGEWWKENRHFSLANNSAVYEGRPSREQFDAEWAALVASGSGERGIFNREASRLQASKYGLRPYELDYGTNPCSEIILRPNQFCNLSTVVVRGDDTVGSLETKVVAATILGTWQSSLTNFKYLRPIWKENTEAERLLGVSMTGALGNRLLNGSISMSLTAEVLSHLRKLARTVNDVQADAMGIQRSAAITCVKPEGTTSQMTGTSSGLHAWHDNWYLRTVRGDKKDPLTSFMMDSGFYYEDDVMNPDHTAVFYFPVAAPEGALTRNDLPAIKHLDLWLTYQRNWCDHKPSVTINVKPEEWAEVGEWVWENFDEVSGVSFLPHSEHTYQQAPYQEVSYEDYVAWTYKMPENVNWSFLSLYETEDATTGTQELNCTAGACEVVDIGGPNVDEEVEVAA